MIFTQTQRTRTVVSNNDTAERHVIISAARTVSPRWCLTTLAILKWLEIIFCVIIAAVLSPYSNHWSAYGYVLFVCIFCLVITVITLIIYFLQLHTGTAKIVPWRALEVTFNIIAVILFLFAFAVCVYDCVKLYDGNYSHHNYFTNEHILSELKHRVAAITAFIGANIIFYILSAMYARSGYM